MKPEDRKEAVAAPGTQLTDGATDGPDAATLLHATDPGSAPAGRPIDSGMLRDPADDRAEQAPPLAFTPRLTVLTRDLESSLHSLSQLSHRLADALDRYHRTYTELVGNAGPVASGAGEGPDGSKPGMRLIPGSVSRLPSTPTPVSADVIVAAEAQLSELELELLRLAAAGLSHQQIALEKCWSEITLGRKFRAIAETLHTANRAQAIEAAKRMGLI